MLKPYHTATDLMTMRVLLGLRRETTAEILECTTQDIKALEDHTTRFVYEKHAEVLESLIIRVDNLIDLSVTGDAPEFLFDYTNDSEFRAYAPELASWMRFNEVHRMFIARVANEWRIETGNMPVVMPFLAQPYGEYLVAEGVEDSTEARTKWGRAYAERISRRDGLPRSQLQRREQRARA